MAVEADSIFPAGSELEIHIGGISGNGQTILRLQQDRNLVLYKSNSPAYQAPNAYGNGNTAIMQDDGNFVLYDMNNESVWASNTAGNPGAYLAVQDDGNLVSTTRTATRCGPPTPVTDRRPELSRLASPEGRQDGTIPFTACAWQ